MSAHLFPARRLALFVILAGALLTTACGNQDRRNRGDTGSQLRGDVADAGSAADGDDVRDFDPPLDAEPAPRDGDTGDDPGPVDGTGWELNPPDDASDAPTTPPDLALTRLSPQRGPTAGGTKFVLQGEGFTDETTVYFGSRRASADLIRGRLVGETPRAPGAGTVTVKALDPETGRDALTDGFTYTPTLELTAARPSTIPTEGGFQITLEGSGFTPETRVSFEGKTALQHDFVDSSTLRVMAPPHPAGPVDVRLTNRSQSTLTPDAVTYAAPLEIETVRPTSGPTGGGTRVRLQGNGFTSNMQVQFDNRTATVLSVAPDGTSATVETPAHPAGLVDVSFATADGDAAIASDRFYYAANTDLHIAAITPDTGSELGGTEVSLIGSGLDSSQLAVAFGTKPATIQANGPGYAVVTTPAHAPGRSDVLAQAGSETSTLADSFTYLRELRLDRIQPTEGTTAGGDVVTVRGDGFTGTTGVKLGGVPASYTVVDDSTLEITTPRHAAGTFDLVVERGDAEATLQDAFSYHAPLEVYGQTPSRGAIAGGTYVLVRGRGFVANRLEVTFGGEKARQTTLLDPHTLAVRTPAHPVGDVEVTVRRETTSSTSPQRFAYFNPSSRDGGTSGGSIDGAVNVSVYASGGAPIADAFVMLSTRPETSFTGRTDRNGQFTFSGPNLRGEQTVSATAPGYSLTTIQQVDAENVTLFLEQNAPIPDRPTPEPDAGPGTGLDAGPSRDVPSTDADTSSDTGSVDPRDAGSPPDPDPDASDDLDPPDPPPELGPPVFEGQLTGLDKLWLPDDDEHPMAIVYTTRQTMRRPNPNPGHQNRLNSNGYYRIRTRVGDLALVALGGLFNSQTREFDVRVMGVRRYQHASKGQTYQRDIDLDIPLDRTLTFKVPERPYGSNGPNTKHFQPYLDFGFEGVFGELPAASGDSSLLEAERYPSLTGKLSDVTISVLGGAYTGHGGGGFGAPYSVIIERDIHNIGQPISLSPLLGVPIMTLPRPGGRPRDNLISFRLTGRHRPDFFRIQIYDRYGRSIVDAFIPGSTTDVQLPVLPDMSDLPDYRRPEPYPNGRYFMRVLALRDPSISLENFSYSDVSIYEAPAYALNYYSIEF